MLPVPLGDGIEPDHLTRQPFGFQKGRHCSGLVNGFGIGKDQKCCGRVQYRRLHGI